jgi:hypothetical protein
MTKLTEIRSGGKGLPAIKISDNLCSTVSTLNQLEDYGLNRPTTNAFAKAKELKNDDLFTQAHKLREIVQRRFDKSRQDRAKTYADYLEAIMSGKRLGGVPPITLFCSGKCEYNEGTTTIFLPYRSVLINIDGETQTEARFILRDRVPESGDWTLGAQIYHGISEQHSSQILHDVNRYAHPIKETVVAALNSEGNITKLIDLILEERHIPHFQLNRHGQKPKTKKGEICSYRSLISAVVGAAGGFQGLQTMGREIGLLNNGGGAMVNVSRPFVEYVIDLIQQDPTIGTSAPALFGLYGAVSRDFGKFVTAQEWHLGAHVHSTFKSGERGKTAMLSKQAAVLASIGVK